MVIPAQLVPYLIRELESRGGDEARSGFCSRQNDRMLKMNDSEESGKFG